MLGEGGMGEVRLCHDHLVGRDVALKVMQPGAAAHAESRERFVREARVQGQLEHPAIVPVYDIGLRENGELYFAMKRVRGVTLRDVVRDERAALAAGLPPLRSRRALLSALSHVCLTVDYAHGRGVVHCDLKPGNVMLGDFGEVYVLDWGLAKCGGVAEPGVTRVGARRVRPTKDEASERGATMAGSLLGTPGYMAPEQARGNASGVGPSADTTSTIARPLASCIMCSTR